MTTNPQALAARFAGLHASITARCPRPVGEVTHEQIRAWIKEVRTVCLDSAAATVDLALTLARRGDLAAAAEARSEAARVLTFARDLGDLMGLPPADPTERH